MAEPSRSVPRLPETGEHANPLEAAYDVEFSRVYGYVWMRVRDGAIADDLTSQVFLRALDRLSTFDPEKAAIGPWLLGIARNLVRDHLRTQRRWRWLPVSWLHGDRAPEPDPEQQAIAGESRLAVGTALRVLSDRERDVLGLKFAGGVSNQRIAQLSGLREAHVAVIVYRALGKLRRELCRADAPACGAPLTEVRRA